MLKMAIIKVLEILWQDYCIRKLRSLILQGLDF